MKELRSWSTNCLVLLSSILLACSSDDLIPLTPDLVSEIKVYDLGNNGNASDMRVDFRVENNLNVLEYRVMLVRAEAVGSFDVEVAAAVGSGFYYEIEPTAIDLQYSISRLPETLTDILGNVIVENQNFVVVILALGTGDRQLSEPSESITLQDRGIYDGQYRGSSAAVGSNECLEVFALDIEFTLQSEGRYTGQPTNPSTNLTLGLISFNLVGSTNSIEVVFSIDEPCANVAPNCEANNFPDQCTGLFEGVGTIEGELTISFTLSGTYDCCIEGPGNQEYAFEFVRQ